MNRPRLVPRSATRLAAGPSATDSPANIRLPVCASVIACVLMASSPTAAQFSTRTDPATEQLRLKAGGTPTDLGRSVSRLIRAKEFAVADAVLTEAAQRSFTVPQQEVIAKEISSDERLKFVTRSDVGEASKTLLNQWFASRRSQAELPERLGQAIEQLTDASPDRELAALKTLFQGGEASVAAIVGKIATTRQPPRPTLDAWLRTALRIDRDATLSALRRIALYGQTDARENALAALTRLSPDEILPELITSLHAVDSPNESTLAATAIARDGSPLPSRTQSVTYLRQALDTASAMAVAMIREPGTEAVWVMTEDRRGVRRQSATPLAIAYRNAADAASRLMRIGDDDSVSFTRQLVAQLAYRIVNDPDWGDEPQVSSIVTAMNLDSTDLRRAMTHAMETNNDAAMIGLIRLAAELGDVDLVAGQPREGGLDQISPLVAAVDHPAPIVRYEAATVIADLIAAAGTPPSSLGNQSVFAGQSRVVDRWLQMRTLGDRPTAVVLETRPEVTLEWERIFVQTGYEPVVVTSVGQLERVISLGADVRLIVAKEQPADAVAIEMIDVVRRISVGRDIPIFVYTRPLPPPIVIQDVVTMSQSELDDSLDVPDLMGVIGGIENLDGVAERELLSGNIDFDRTRTGPRARQPTDVQTLGQNRWGDRSRSAGLIRMQPRPRSALGLYEIVSESRRRMHLPPLSTVDRQRFRRSAGEALN